MMSSQYVPSGGIAASVEGAVATSNPLAPEIDSLRRQNSQQQKRIHDLEKQVEEQKQEIDRLTRQNITLSDPAASVDKRLMQVLWAPCRFGNAPNSCAAAEESGFAQGGQAFASGVHRAAHAGPEAPNKVGLGSESPQEPEKSGHGGAIAAAVAMPPMAGEALKLPSGTIPCQSDDGLLCSGHGSTMAGTAAMPSLTGEAPKPLSGPIPCRSDDGVSPCSGKLHNLSMPSMAGEVPQPPNGPIPCQSGDNVLLCAEKPHSSTEVSHALPELESNHIYERPNYTAIDDFRDRSDANNLILRKGDLVTALGVYPDDESWLWVRRSYGGPNGQASEGYVPRSVLAESPAS